ncbi:hypothetical protein AVEN_258892-1 [Araneus ventricosus]|uniref:Uncharacterized protein n=1 Tax=Araneus ventricosus TaxID=182803 RepID=A0A4Y1ZVQ0_ARAVE|nr:hypothetical protein AVEN_258892-1 [Araneus ventricosus]
MRQLHAKSYVVGQISSHWCDARNGYQLSCRRLHLPRFNITRYVPNNNFPRVASKWDVNITGVQKVSSICLPPDDKWDVNTTADQRVSYNCSPTDDKWDVNTTGIPKVSYTCSPIG